MNAYLRQADAWPPPPWQESLRAPPTKRGRPALCSVPCKDDPRATGWPGSWSKGQSRFDRGLAPLSPLKMTGTGRGGERRLCRRRTVQVWHVRCAHWGRRRFALRRAGRTRRCHNDVLLGLVDVQPPTCGPRPLHLLGRFTPGRHGRGEPVMADAAPVLWSWAWILRAMI